MKVNFQNLETVVGIFFFSNRGTINFFCVCKPEFATEQTCFFIRNVLFFLNQSSGEPVSAEFQDLIFRPSRFVAGI